MRYDIEEQALPWGMVVIEGVTEPLAELADADENGVWTDGGTITVLAFDPVELPVSLWIQKELPSEPGMTRVFDGYIQVTGNSIRIGDTTEDTFIVSGAVATDRARIIVDVDVPQSATKLIISIPDLIDQKVLADEITTG